MRKTRICIMMALVTEKQWKKALIVPDYLFFGEEVGKNIDLSEWYGDKKKKKSFSPRNN